MPLVERSTYRIPSILFNNGHVQSIYPALFRKVTINYQREQFETADNDFLDLDYSKVGARKIVVICHGLEGSADDHYIKATARAVNERGWDALAMNFRACGGEVNRLARTYHAGDTHDLHEVLQWQMNEGYEAIALVGYSLGGNVILKYLGEQGKAIDPRIKGAVAYSVPCDLGATAMHLTKWHNKIYMKRFALRLRRKLQQKQHLLPNDFDMGKLKRIKSFKEFDDLYTARFHHFEGAEDYWEKASSKPYLANIAIPTLLVNAADDPFLTTASYPIEEAKQSEMFWLEIPPSGGHVGFVTFSREYWSETRTCEFLDPLV